MTEKTKEKLREELLKDPTNTQKFNEYVDKVNQDNPNAEILIGDEGLAKFEEILKRAK